MTAIYHLLGADIPHHNHTVLRFFAQPLRPYLTPQHQFWVVGKAQDYTDYPALNLRFFTNKNAVAQALRETNRADRAAQFIFHGQFNFRIWLDLLLNLMDTKRCRWHVWGADLYEQSNRWQFKLLYPLRRLAQQKLPELWATRGDLAFAHQHLTRDTQRDKLLYFPTKLPPRAEAKPPRNTADRAPMTILLGNSGDSSNRHLAALNAIAAQFPADQIERIVIPMGYPANNEHYIAQVEQRARALFGADKIDLLREQLDFTRYLALISQCDCGYFLFERQQGIGTICLLLQANIPVILSRQNGFYHDLRANQLPFLFEDEANLAAIVQQQAQLAAHPKDQIDFLAPHYEQGWIARLTELNHL